jgi:hypothetical protein
MDQDLTDALDLLLRGYGQEAIEKAAPWTETWVAKCIIFLANSFFLLEPTEAVNTFGGDNGFKHMITSDCIERHFIQGYGRLLRREEEAAESNFESAMKLAPTDPFVQFSLVLIYTRHRNLDKARDVFSLMAQQNQDHPLLVLLREAHLDIV